MRVLVVGGGAREHAIVWKLKQSPHVTDIICAPGNSAIAQLATCVDLRPWQIGKLADLAMVQGADLTVASDPQSIQQGIVEFFKQHRLRIFGPEFSSTQLWQSRYLAKEFMLKNKIPTARYAMFERPELARAYVAARQPPIVLKTDQAIAWPELSPNQAQVIIAESHQQANQFLEQAFAENCQKVIVEDFVSGLEISWPLICDGSRNVAMLPVHNHTRLHDEDQGPLTRGMGAYTPCLKITERMLSNTVARIVDPLMKALAASGTAYAGALELNLIFEADGSPRVISLGTTLSDLGTQVLLPLLEEDLFEIFWAVTEKNLAHFRLNGFRFNPSTCLAIAITTDGTKGDHLDGRIDDRIDSLTGCQIEGLPDLENSKQIHIEKQVVEHGRPVTIDVCPYVFHEGSQPSTDDPASGIETASQRVLTLAVVAENLLDAKVAAYELCKGIKSDNLHYRRDIGDRGLD